MYKKFLFGYQGSWLGVLRTAFWCVLFLYMAGFLFPQLPENLPLATATQGTPLTPMVTIPEDPRAIRKDITLDKSKFNIAWLMESTGVILPQGKNFVTANEEEKRLIPKLVIDRLHDKNKTPDFAVQLYGRLGYRPIDLMVFMQRALQSKPDLIVIPINYAWSFSHYQIANRKLALNLAPRVWAADLAQWWLAPVFSTPSQLLWAFSGSFLPVVNDAVKNKQYLETVLPLNVNATAQTLDVTMRQPKTQVDFWLVNAMMQGDRKALEADDGSLSVSKRYAEIIRHNAPGDEDSFATYSLLEMLEAARKSGIPTLVYLPPVSDDYYADQSVKNKIEEIEAYMDSLRQKYRGTNVHIISTVPEDVRKTIRFQKDDGFHQYDPGTYAAYLAEEVWKIISPVQKTQGSIK